VSEGIENALNLIVRTAKQSGSMKKELKQTIFETVSTLRNLFVTLKDSRDGQSNIISELEGRVAKMKAELEEGGAPSFILSQEPARMNARGVTPSGVREGKLYWEALGSEKKLTRFKLTVKSKENQSSETINGLLKSKINPTEIKVGINTFKSLKNWNVLIETNSKEEIEAPWKVINVKCGDKLEANIHKLRNPRLVIINIPDDISTENLEDTLITQNPDLRLVKGDTKTKFSYETKKHTRNLVKEVGPQTRKLLLQNKVKLGWLICKIEDYVVPNRCLKCSRFKQRFRDWRGEETCPLCAGRHKLRECTASPTEFKCINCLTHNKYNQSKNICTNHSSLDKYCPSLQAILEKYSQNTD
jgi:hypothetical protein